MSVLVSDEKWLLVVLNQKIWLKGNTTGYYPGPSHHLVMMEPRPIRKKPGFSHNEACWKEVIVLCIGHLNSPFKCWAFWSLRLNSKPTEGCSSKNFGLALLIIVFSFQAWWHHSAHRSFFSGLVISWRQVRAGCHFPRHTGYATYHSI